MRIYVAGSTKQMEQVRGIQEELIGHGHTITYDWTNYVMQHGDAHRGNVPDDIQRDGAEQDLSGVQGAQAVVAYVTPECIGTLIEIGMAIHKNIPVLVLMIGPDTRDSVFYRLGAVTCTRVPEGGYFIGPLREWLEKVNS